MRKRAAALVIAALALGGVFALYRWRSSAWPLANNAALPSMISGTIVDASGPVANAIVQVQGTPNQTTTAANGAFTLNGISGTKAITITAWSVGNYIGWSMLDPNAPDRNAAQSITIRLEPHPTGDNYQSAGFSSNGVTGAASCGQCHRENSEWLADAHSRSSQDVHFVTLYQGTDARGRLGQPTQYALNGKPLLPDASQPYYGPGFRLDDPTHAGNCATCHAPLAARISNEKNCSWSGCHTNVTVEHSNGLLQPGVVPTSLTLRAQEGVNCEFCHQAGDVMLNSQRLPNTDRPGILSMRMYRPPEGKVLFFGTMVDVTRKDTYLPLLSKSEFCAACHYGVLGGVVGMDTVSGGTLIYSSYSEWLNSVYSNSQTGKSCQDCHMPAASAHYTVPPASGGITRDWFAFHSHRMLGASDEQFMKTAVTVKSDAARENNSLHVNVNITNSSAGHDIPTDSPIRQMILVVEAFDANGKRLSLEQGPLNPAWAGDYAGQAGKTFQQVLQDQLSGEMPTAAFWRQTTVAQDTRLAPLATDSTQYTFELTDRQAAQVKVRLIYRRAMQSLAQQKGWNDADILLAQEVIQVTD